MMATKIEWTRSEDGTLGETWNPVRGCTKISPGCSRCYAFTFAERWRGIPGHPYEQGFDLRLVPEKLAGPLKRKKPTTYFVNSMSDLFHEGVPDEYIDKVFAVMALAKQHTFQVLTKRAERMRDYLNTPTRHNSIELAADELLPGKGHAPFGGKHMLPSMPFGNVWCGVSVENQRYADERIPHLIQTPAAVRFISAEPLLGAIDISHWLESDLDRYSRDDRFGIPSNVNTAKLNWVITGAESGHGARPMQDEWARSIKEQCVAAGVPFFFKQQSTRTGKKIPLPVLDGQQWVQMPERKGAVPT